MPDGLRLAVGTLTCFPVAAPRRVDRATAAQAMLLAPLAAALLLVPVGVVVVLLRIADVPAAVQAVVAVGLLALGTRALHLDGLADTADGLSASYDRERALAVMRTGDVGPAGAATVVLVLALQIACGAALLASTEGAVVAAVAVVASRLGITWACVRGVPSARPDGLGATVVGAVPVAASVVTTAGLTLLAAWTTSPWWAGPAVVAAALAASAAVVLRCRARLGGVTGDVLGSVAEIACAAALLAGATAVS